MLNEEKIRYMTKAASYEAGEGRKALSVNKYFRGDYISLQLIHAWISFTVAFVLCAGLWAFYHMEYLMSNIHKMDLPAMGRSFGLLYLSLLAVYLVVNYMVYHSRYQETRKQLTVYSHILKRIAHIYQAEAKTAGGDYTSEGAGKHDNLTGI